MKLSQIPFLILHLILIVSANGTNNDEKQTSILEQDSTTLTEIKPSYKPVGKPSVPQKNNTTQKEPEDDSEEAQQHRYYVESAKTTLKVQKEQIEKAIALLKKKYTNIDDELKNTDAKNPNLNDIDFSLLNTTNHLIIDFGLSREQQEEMTLDEVAENGNATASIASKEEGGGGESKAKKSRSSTRVDANQQATQCILQDISYICVGKGIRKCCSNDAIADTQCINTEDYYNGQKLSDFDEYSDNDEVFVGKNAVFLNGSKKKVMGEDDLDDVDLGLDPETIYGGQPFSQITFDKSQILKKNGPLTHPNNILCSDTLRDSVSFYAQFELVPTFTEVCGSRYINASMSEQYVRSQDLNKKNSKVTNFGKYSTCVYEVYNPYPTHTLYLNIYRKSNNSDIGIYYQKASSADTAAARKSPLMPRGTKDTIKHYVPGEWTNATIPIETEDHKNLFHTFKVQYPARNNFYFDMNDHMKDVGGNFHNVTDILRQYSFEGVDRINVVVIGQSEHSQFDFGIQVGVFSTAHTRIFNDNWPYLGLGLLVLLALYFMVLSVMYGIKARNKYQEF